MSYAVGSLVRARGREWVVLPESDDGLVMLRPLGGSEDEVAGVCPALEEITPARFTPPSTKHLGDYRSCRLLRDSVRLGFRSSAGPFRSFARIAVEPRPYQLVPLLMALKLDPVRMLIADDVGIGKTIEACLIARELLDRGEVRRIAVLCPPHLAGQWQRELKEKFHINAELVLSGTAMRLERNCAFGQSLFDVYPHVIVSSDFIKSDRRRDEFLRTCPELVIVDEAHTFAFAGGTNRGRHQRHQLLSGLAEDKSRNLILVTATPHSGKEEAFRSLLTFLDSDFANLPEDLAGKANEQHRRRLAQHFVQRRRADIKHYMDSETPFPTREDAELAYSLSPGYKKLFNKVLEYARELVRDDASNQLRQRVRWWSALALLRALASSPAAASATLRTRAATADFEDVQSADDFGRRTVLDIDSGDEMPDINPGGVIDSEETSPHRRRLLEMAREADSLKGDADHKLQQSAEALKKLLEAGHNPIVFCRFVATAEYLAEQLRHLLGKKVEVSAVTGLLPHQEREERIHRLAQHPSRVLVATDCLSEGINLQAHFDAVFHYDLSWNPTRHEQRDGRVDRFGQPREKVRVVTYYGRDNQIDGIILDVLIRKHQKIRSSLGISVPVPMDSNEVVEAIFEGILLRQTQEVQQLTFEFMQPTKEALFERWDDVTAREKRSRTMFAQESIKVEEVSKEFQAVRSAIGTEVDVESFVREAFSALRVTTTGRDLDEFDFSDAPLSLVDVVGNQKIRARFKLPVDTGVEYFSRTHPVVEGVANYVFNTAMDDYEESPARRCGVIRTGRVAVKTTLLLARFRYSIITERDGAEYPLLAEDCHVLGFTGSPGDATWLDSNQIENLIQLEPEENIAADQARYFLENVLKEISQVQPHLETVAEQLAATLLDAHRRVRNVGSQKGLSFRVEPYLPPDILGLYIFVPRG